MLSDMIMLGDYLFLNFYKKSITQQTTDKLRIN